MLIVEKFRVLFSSTFAKSVSVVAGGTVLAQLLGIMTAPIITRLYSPEDYGVLSLYAAILGVFTVVGALKYEMAVPIADTDTKALVIVVISLSIITTISFFSFFVIYFTGNSFFRLLNVTAITPYRSFIPLGIFLAGCYNIFKMWAFRKKKFKTISTTTISQSITQSFVKISLGTANFGPAGLLIGSILGQSAGVTALILPFLKQLNSLKKSVTKKSLAWGIKRYRRFAIYMAPSQIFNSLGLHLPVFCITMSFGAEVVGLYGFAHRIISLPMSFIGRAIADVFYAEAATIGRSNPPRLKTLMDKLFKRLIFLGLFPFITLILWGSSLFTFVFGQKWELAGEYAQILSLIVYVRLVVTPITNIFSVYEKQKEALLLDFTRTIMVASVFFFSGIFKLTSHDTIILYTLSMVTIYILTFFIARKIISQEVLVYEKDNKSVCKL